MLEGYPKGRLGLKNSGTKATCPLAFCRFFARLLLDKLITGQSAYSSKWYVYCNLQVMPVQSIAHIGKHFCTNIYK